MPRWAVLDLPDLAIAPNTGAGPEVRDSGGGVSPRTNGIGYWTLRGLAQLHGKRAHPLSMERLGGAQARKQLTLS